MSMRIGKETYLNERNRNRSITPWLQLTTIDRHRRNPFDTLSPLPRLLMIGKTAPKGKYRRMCHAGSRALHRNQPAIKFNRGARPGWHRGTGRWQHLL